MYLENSICNFIPLFDIDYTKKKNIISISLFKMSNSGYKNFDQYIDGLTILCEKVKSSYNNFTIRIFIDNSIFNDKNLLSKLKNLKLEIVVYTCPDYIINNEFHYGTFGTFVRFFPMFDFPNNDADLVMIQDADYDEFGEVILNENIDIINKLNLYIDYKNCYILKFGDLYNSFKSDSIVYKNIVNYYTVSSSLIGINKINYNVIVDFIKSVKNKNYIISRYNLSENENKHRDMNKFIYGIDEYFLNNTLMQYIIDNKLPFININKFDLYTKIYKYFKYYNIHLTNNKSLKIFDKIFTLILDRLKIKYKNATLKEKYDIIDNLINGKNKNLIIKIYKILYKIFLVAYKNKAYQFLFPKNMYKILLTTKYFGLYQYDTIIFEFTNYDTITILENRFDKDYINYLKKYLDTKNIKINKFH